MLSTAAVRILSLPKEAVSLTDMFMKATWSARSWVPVPPIRSRGWRMVSLVVVVTLWLSSAASDVTAHHSGHRMSGPSAKCGFIDGDNLRDRRHLTDFCAGAALTNVRIRSASATRERLWIEAPPEVGLELQEEARSTAALLKQWLVSWKETTGYRTASVTLMRGHAEVARIQTTMDGEVVVIP